MAAEICNSALKASYRFPNPISLTVINFQEVLAAVKDGAEVAVLCDLGDKFITEKVKTIFKKEGLAKVHKFIIIIMFTLHISIAKGNKFENRYFHLMTKVIHLGDCNADLHLSRQLHLPFLSSSF